ncbi:hypothetical protein GCM10010497_17730 [Streptomyces cinereoruber]|uniref:LLM class flavin-dependent oxidoreductase n=1 Tax=Streptomyces cinereoruber TaxID=67260 RepID=A0AAV4KIL6_9ACTN|nr:hypothetical protein [Streptomyces cinereoruber]NIH62075.1 hypothetical protein [Streptomyces cinereoruber]GGR15879.1 hypothetical protein GCM10010497_17730 [Streptomyces cinereoruber]
MPALWARSRGERTRFVGLTRIEERQAVLVAPGSPVRGAAALRGLRLAVPRHSVPIDFWRAMALRGFEGALASAGAPSASACASTSSSATPRTRPGPPPTGSSTSSARRPTPGSPASGPGRTASAGSASSAGTAVVGSTAQVVERLQEFQDLGVDTFILSGNPLLEEAYRVAETVLPALGVTRRGRGRPTR